MLLSNDDSKACLLTFSIDESLIRLSSFDCLKDSTPELLKESVTRMLATLCLFSALLFLKILRDVEKS